MIDVTKPESYPDELSRIVLSHIKTISDQEMIQIKHARIKSEKDVMIAIEGFLGISAAYNMYKNELIPAFNQHELLCYHATRVDCIESITRNGIFSDMGKYRKFIASFMKTEGLDDEVIHDAMDLILKEYERKYYGKPHQICFFVNYTSLYDKEGYAAYDQFYETVGGELAHWALENKLPTVLSVLQEKGIPVVIKFKIPFSKVAEYHKDSLIFPFVCSIAAKHIWGYNYAIEADSSFIGEVPPCDIIEVIKVDKRITIL